MAAEAPPGVGKTFAVLIPAILQAWEEGKRILFLTASIALQEQLIGKDLPRLVSLLGRNFNYGLLKGRSNYICLRKAASLQGGLWLQMEEGGAVPPDLARWIEEGRLLHREDVRAGIEVLPMSLNALFLTQRAKKVRREIRSGLFSVSFLFLPRYFFFFAAAA